MNKGSQQGSVTAIAPIVDWVAYEYLQTKLLRTSNRFRQEALEFALQKLLSPLPRTASGKQLALDLFRDGKRHVKVRLRTSGKYIQAEHFFHEIFTTESDALRADYCPVDPCSLLSKGFGRLTIQERTALYLRAVGYDSAELVEQHLHIGIRQFRNLLQASRKKLRKTRGFEVACHAHHASGLIDEPSVVELLENTLFISTQVA